MHQWSQTALGYALSLEEEEKRREFMHFFWDMFYRFLKTANREIQRLLEDFG
jgi:hypothetical protein